VLYDPRIDWEKAMSRSILCVAIPVLAITAVFGIWTAVGRASARTAAAPESDLQAIQRLHQQDIDATLARDPQALADLFTDDAVLLEPGAPAVIGRPAILADNKKDTHEHPDAKVLSYKPEIKDLQVVDGWAFEWDTFEASYKESGKAEVKTFRAKALRILKKQPDGSWKFARVMWNLAEGG
jgi:uncharacterized protein (TIGR02246 family)